jgi:hypothetical protein
MGLFRSGPDLPPVIRSAVRGRPLAAAETGDAAWLVGTRDTLQAVDAAGHSTLTVGWERVHRADWDVDSNTLQVEQVADYGRPVSACSFVLDEPGALLELVRERVTASVVLQRRTDIERRRGFSVIGRRAPAGGGEVSWAFEFDKGVDPDDPAVMARAEAALRDAKESLGL